LTAHVESCVSARPVGVQRLIKTNDAETHPLVGADSWDIVGLSLKPNMLCLVAGCVADDRVEQRPTDASTARRCASLSAA